ncbi:hypothetical protein ACFL4G_04685 [Thermodesulfobacteriota bacterium]
MNKVGMVGTLAFLLIVNIFLSQEASADMSCNDIVFIFDTNNTGNFSGEICLNLDTPDPEHSIWVKLINDLEVEMEYDEEEMNYCYSVDDLESWEALEASGLSAGVYDFYLDSIGKDPWCSHTLLSLELSDFPDIPSITQPESMGACPNPTAFDWSNGADYYEVCFEREDFERDDNEICLDSLNPPCQVPWPEATQPGDLLNATVGAFHFITTPESGTVLYVSDSETSCIAALGGHNISLLLQGKSRGIGYIGIVLIPLLFSLTWRGLAKKKQI